MSVYYMCMYVIEKRREICMKIRVRCNVLFVCVCFLCRIVVFQGRIYRKINKLRRRKESYYMRELLREDDDDERERRCCCYLLLLIFICSCFRILTQYRRCWLLCNTP